jgi:hypothetical protein
VWLGLPWLEAHAATCDSGFPKRFGVFFWGNGNLPDRWTPQETGPVWTPSEQLMPLARHQPKLTVCTGLEVKVPNTSPHWSGAVGLLTGTELTGDDDEWEVQGPTIDQVIAQQIGTTTLYPSLQVGIADEECFSYTGPNQPNYGETDPYALYQRLFGGTFQQGGDGGVDPSLGYRRSVLDAVLGDLDRLSTRLGAEDRIRLEAHADSVRTLEQRLARLQEDPPDLAACVQPGAPAEDYPDVDGRPQLSARSRAFSDLLAMALACDQTRVFTLSQHRAISNVLYPERSDGVHNLTHNEPGDQPEVNQVVLAVMEELAYLLDALDAVDEGEGTLLDHSLVLAASEISEGRTHRLDEMPLLLAGGACGSLVKGHHLRSNGSENINHAMLSVLRAFDVVAPTWGQGDSLVDTGWAPLEGA